MKRNAVALALCLFMLGSVLALGAKGNGAAPASGLAGPPEGLPPGTGNAGDGQNDENDENDENGEDQTGDGGSARRGPPDNLPVPVDLDDLPIPVEIGSAGVDRILLVLVQEGTSQEELGKHCEVLDSSDIIANLYYVKVDAAQIGKLRTLPFVLMMTDSRGVGIFASYLKESFRERRDEILEAMGYGEAVDGLAREDVEKKSRETVAEGVSPFSEYVTPQDAAVLQALENLDHSPEAIYDWVASMILWISDRELLDAEERWLMPGECLSHTPGMPPIIGSIKSDCEEQANTLASMLRAAGLGPEMVRVVLGKVSFQGIEGGHAWVEVLTGDGWLAVDPTSGGWIKDGTLNDRNPLNFQFFAAFPYPETERWYEYNDLYHRDHLGRKQIAPVQWDVSPATIESLLTGELRDLEKAAGQIPRPDLPVDLDKLRSMKGLLFGTGSRLAYREGVETILSWVPSDEAAGYAIYAADSVEKLDFSAPNDQVGNSTQVWKDTSATDARYYVVRQISPEGEILEDLQVAGLFQRHLGKGWNIVSFPYETDFTASSLLEQIGGAATSIARRSADGGLYEQYIVDPISGVGFGRDFDIVRDEAYYVWLQSEADVTLSGVVDYSTSVSIELKAGRWNLVGKPSFTAATISETFSDLSGGAEIAQVARRMPDGSFEFYIEGFTSTEFLVEPAEGYYVWVSRDTTWTVHREL